MAKRIGDKPMTGAQRVAASRRREREELQRFRAFVERLALANVPAWSGEARQLLGKPDPMVEPVILPRPTLGGTHVAAQVERVQRKPVVPQPAKPLWHTLAPVGSLLKGAK
jgi:hypothetical protein